MTTKWLFYPLRVLTKENKLLYFSDVLLLEKIWDANTGKQFLLPFVEKDQFVRILDISNWEPLKSQEVQISVVDALINRVLHGILTTCTLILFILIILNRFQIKAIKKKSRESSASNTSVTKNYSQLQKKKKWFLLYTIIHFFRLPRSFCSFEL